MMMRTRWQARRVAWLTGLAVVVGLSAGCGAIQSTEGAASNDANATTVAQPVQLPIPGHPAPSFSLTNLSTGQAVSLQQLLGKQPLILNVWASWCGPCNAETPDLVKAAAKYGNQVQFVGVNLTSLDSPVKEKAFVEKYHIPYTILSDTKGKFYQTYGITAVPTTYVINSKGVVVSVHTGQIASKQALEKIVDEAIAAG